MRCELLREELAVSLEETIATHLRRRGWHLALVETTTGGGIAARLVRLAGSSAYFDRSIVAYSKEAKIESLGMDPAVFERSGAVSLEAATTMAESLRRLSHADIVLAETGIAGPILGRSPKPIGTACFALLTPTDNLSEEVRFAGDRQAIQEQIAGHALGMIARYLTSTLQA
jgi:PncC family amidohydrolase